MKPSPRDQLIKLIESWHWEANCPRDCECNPADRIFKGFTEAQADVLIYELIREWEEQW